MRRYVFAFHQLADFQENLPATVKARTEDSRVETAEYILACYSSHIDGFNPSVATKGITGDEDDWRNMVRADALGVAKLLERDDEKESE